MESDCFLTRNRPSTSKRVKTEHRTADLLEIHLVAELATKVVNHKMKMAYKDNTDDHIRDDDGDREAVGPSVSAEYYSRGSVELATESALTLAKIQHVSSNTPSLWRTGK